MLRTASRVACFAVALAASASAGSDFPDEFGGRVAGAGDLDGDGTPDVLVTGVSASDESRHVYAFSGKDGKRLWDVAAADFAAAGDGTVFVAKYLDRADASRQKLVVLAGKDGAVVRELTRAADDAARGFAELRPAGDVNGDGKPDLLVAPLPEKKAAGGAPGIAYLPPKPTSIEIRSGADGSAIVVLKVGVHAFGDAAAVVGDVDGDGAPEVVVRAEEKGTHDRVDLVRARDGKVLRSFEGEDETGFGETLAPAGDVNGDGSADVIVGTPRGSPNGRKKCGMLRVHSGKTGLALFLLMGGKQGDEFGAAAAGGVDANGDGVADLVIGAPGVDPGKAPGAGEATVVSGKDRKVLARVRGTAAGDNLGRAVAWAGDVDGDGVPDFVVGAPSTKGVGAAFVCSGKDGKRLVTLSSAK